ncbi:MAG: hypothetical protein AAFV53_04820 [Myxococcota bacterium]
MNDHIRAGVRRGAIYLAALFGLSVLCGSGPAPEVAEVTVGGGGGRYSFVSSGCGPAARYRVTERAVYGSAQGRIGEHMTVAIEGATGNGDVREYIPLEETSSDASPPNTATANFTAARLGGDWERFGFALGAALYAQPERDGTIDALPFPSLTLWAGAPQKAYGFFDVASGPIVGANVNTFVKLGVGHQHDRYEGQAYLTPGGFGLSGAKRLVEGLWLGVSASARPEGGLFGQDADLQLMGRLTYRFGATRRKRSDTSREWQRTNPLPSVDRRIGNRRP